MNDIRPFRGWHYHGDVSSLIAPPYDILTGEDKKALLAKSPDNIVSVDMPHVPPKELGPEQRVPAGRQETLPVAGLRRAEPGRSAGAVRLQPDLLLGRAVVHAGGHAVRRAGDGVWRGRRGRTRRPSPAPRPTGCKLTELTGVQLSPIFGFYEDTAGVSAGCCERLPPGGSRSQGSLNGVARSAVGRHRSRHGRPRSARPWRTGRSSSPTATTATPPR